MKTLTKQIEMLKIKDAHDKKAAALMGSIEHLAIVHEWKNKNTFRIVARCKNTDEFKQVLRTLPPTNTTTTIGTATDRHYKVLNTPFRTDIENPAQAGRFSYYLITFGYQSGKYDIQIELPISFVSEFVTSTERPITDSEYHYFIGYSHNELRNLRVRSYRFNCLDEMGWYGGNKTLLNEAEITKIVDFLKK